MESRRRLQDWHHMLAMCSVMAAVSGGLAYLFLHIDLIPNPASMGRGLIDSFIQLLFAIAGVFCSQWQGKTFVIQRNEEHREV